MILRVVAIPSPFSPPSNEGFLIFTPDKTSKENLFIKAVVLFFPVNRCKLCESFFVGAQYNLKRQGSRIRLIGMISGLYLELLTKNGWTQKKNNMFPQMLMFIPW